MKRFFKSVLAFIFVLCCFSFIGCGDKYSDLKFSLSFSYSQTDTVEILSDGTRRVKTTGLVFDEKLDGNYTFYLSQKDVSQNKFPKATLKVSYSGYPSDFNFGATASSSNTEVLSNAISSRKSGDDAYLDITVCGVGQSELTVLNNETGRSQKIYVDVKGVASSLAFSQNNIAFANVSSENSKINLLSYLSTNDTTNLTFKFGVKNGENFTEYDSSTLSSTYGLSFDKSTGELSLDRKTTLSTLDVLAIYTSPIGDNLQAETRIRFLNDITDFNIYAGQSFEDTKNENNRINSESLLEFYSNLTDGSYKDLVLVAKSNGEKVKFDLSQNETFPFTTDIEISEVKYLTASLVSTTYDKATYAYQVVRVVASKNTEDKTKYGEDRSYNLVISCEYADYTVPSYPLFNTIKTKAYDLIKAFKVNNVKGALTFSDALEQDIFFNSSVVAGEKFFVEIYDQPTILQENSKFFVEFYDKDRAKLERVNDYLTVSYQEKNSQRVVTLENNDFGVLAFNKETTFYVKPSEGSTLRAGDKIYMAFRAQKPAEEQAVAFCFLNVCEGIENISKIDYSFNQFQIGDGDYVLDNDGNRIVDTVTDSSNFVKVDEHIYESEKTINLDSDVENVSAYVTLSYTPVTAKLSNLSVVSKNTSLVQVVRAGEDNAFVIVPQKVTSEGGDAIIEITASNLVDIYRIRVKVYTAINKLNVTLNDPKGTALIVNENGDVKSAIVEYQKRYDLSVSIQPVSKKYEIKYDVYRASKADDNLVGSLTCEYSDLTMSVINGVNSGLINDSKFSFDAHDFGFSFVDDTKESYILVLSIINANGTIIKREITLSSYVPVATMEVSSFRSSIYDANNIYYENKVLNNVINEKSLLLDESVFGVKVNLTGKGDKNPTYTFQNNGYITISIDGQKETTYKIQDGTLTSGSLGLGTKVKALSLSPIRFESGDTYYIFRLQEEYKSQNSIGSVLVTAGIEQFGNPNKVIEKSTKIDILPVSQVLGLTPSTTDINFKQGQTKPAEFQVALAGDKIKNDNLLTKVIGIKNFRNQTYYFESDGTDGLFSLSLSGADLTAKDYTLSVYSTFIGQGFAIFVPQDKVTTKENFDNFFNFSFVTISDLTLEEFVPRMFYILDNENNYVLAHSYEENRNYYLRVVDRDVLSSVYNDMAVVNFSVSDGLSIPYHISTLDDLLSIGESQESVTKNYILTKDIEIGNKNFAPIGNYYHVNLTEEQFTNRVDTYYINVDGSFVVASNYDEDNVYYAYGFNGTFTGKYVIPSLKGDDIIRYYDLTGINYEGVNPSNVDGIFARLGENGKISDLGLVFDTYNMSFASNAGGEEVTNVVGGLVATNFGRIENISVTFDGYFIKTEENLTLGGIIGVNYGTFDNSTIRNSAKTTGTIMIDSSKQNAELLIGGFVGENKGVVIGSNKVVDSFDIAYDDLGFDCNLILSVQDQSQNGEDSNKSSIGLVAGKSIGLISNFAINGRISASKMDNVGGIVGYIEYGELQVEDDGYALKDSYSIARVQGRSYVGGVIGQTFGRDSNLAVKVYNVSAENYDTMSYATRVFVRGKDYVGGLVGRAMYSKFEYSYVASYYKFDENSFDIEGDRLVGGFIGNAQNISVSQCASFINVEVGAGGTNGGLFIAMSSGVSAQNSFAYGYGKNLTTRNLGFAVSDYNTNQLYIIFYNVNEDNKLYVNNVENKTIDSISITENNYWKKAEEGSLIPYYLLKDGKPLMAVSPTIDATVKEVESYERFIGVTGQKAVVLFLVEDSSGVYTNEQIERLNTIDVGDIFDIDIDPLTYKTSKISISTTKPTDILTISDGKIVLKKEGNVTLKIASKLTTLSNTEIEIIVMKGVSDVKVYSNDSVLRDISGSTMEVVKNSPQTLYSRATYDRTLDGKNISFRASSKGIGVRFMIDKTNIPAEYKDNLNAILAFNNVGWENLPELDYQFVDIEDSTNITLIAKLAQENAIAISYIPFIRKTVSGVLTTILLDKLKGEFDLIIKSGATNIVIENNVDPNVVMGQLEKFSFVITAYTDVAGDTIEYYCDKVLDGTTIDVSSVKKSSSNGQISYTFTFFYVNKLEPLKESLYYTFEFYASSNPLSTKQITITITPQKDLNSISSRVYSERDKDFPQSPSQNNIIYNGRPALLTLEAYPYLADFTTLRLRYLTSSTKALSITQLEYNASQAGSGNMFSVNLNYGAEYDSTGALIVRKESAQDVYVGNGNGVYSYSRFFFFSLLIPSDTADKSVYNLIVDVVDSKGNIVFSQPIVLNTLSKTEVDLKFDERFKGADETYYLPVNTKQKLDVVTTNNYETANWEVSSTDVVLTQRQKEIFTPYLENGAYYVNTMNFSKNEFSTDLIGKTIKLTLTLDSGKTADAKSILFNLSLFTVTNISANGVTDGYMSVKNSTTTPLLVDIEAVYDESVVTSANNWYTTWFNKFGEDNSDSLYQLLTNSGYSIRENFADYIASLQEKVTKASFDSKAKDDSAFVSGVWLYKNAEGTLSALRCGSTYNNKTFGVENYEGYVAIYGYEEDVNSSLSLNVRLSYSNRKDSVTYRGIPNVENYNYDASVYSSVFTFSQDFILNFVSALSFYNPTPVSSVKEFMELENDESGDYRLISDLILTDFRPFEAKFKSFDGNNYKIYILSFADTSNESSSGSFGLFTNISSSTMICNTTVYYTSRVDYDSRIQGYVPRSTPMTLDISAYSSVRFGGLSVTNNGVITNCKVSGAVSIDSTRASSSSNLMGGLVSSNASSGFITNSKVIDFNFTASGQIGGFVGKNDGMIVSSAFENSQILGLSANCDIGGFVYENSGSISESFVQGARATTDSDIRNTGSGIISRLGGNIGAFVYANNATISDCYTNILASTSKNKSGFVYTDSGSSVISRCYSIFYKASGDNTTAIYPFVGPNGDDIPPRVVVNGTLNNCYYLTVKTSGYWATDLFYTSSSQTTSAYQTPDNKKAFGLEVDDFATHDSFANFDMSLKPNTVTVAYKQYYYVDGYTWVIIGGKPLIVSTLTDTISMHSYIGKKKNYYLDDQVLYNLTEGTKFHTESTDVGLENNLTLTKYFIENTDGVYNEKDVVFTKLYNKSLAQSTFEYKLDNDYSLKLVASETAEGLKFSSAEYGNGEKQILDIKVLSKDNIYIDQDDNFRANDTVVIETNDAGDISRITLKTLQSASYYYSENVKDVSELKGTRTNPYLLYDYESFVETLSEDTDGKFYRLVRDIDLGNSFVKTSSKTFRGVLQGNHMTLSNLAISYFNNQEKVEDMHLNQESFGLFAEIATATKASMQDTVISNITLNVSEVISNSHKYVGALSGRLLGGNGSKKIFLNNINIVGDSNTYLAGKNAVGALSGFATGNVIIKDINVSASVNATYNALLNKKDMLYIRGASTDKVSYAGGVVGIFDVTEVVDPSTLKNYNASNVKIDSSRVYQGNIVGSAFGLVGENAIVNYVNVEFDLESNSYIKATVYAGGLVGENRGRIISSSVKYLGQESMTMDIAPRLDTADNIFFETPNNTISGLGGLVGLNNGGFISNSISTLNVRNKTSVVVGGAVGRMVGGGLINVVATGAVLGSKVVGGFIGSVNDRDILTTTEAGYNKNAFLDFTNSTVKKNFNARSVYMGGNTLPDNVTTLISSCVAGNNYLSSDYYALNNLLISNEYAFAGFIGIIAFYSENDAISPNCKDAIMYGNKSYFVNTLYSSQNTSTVSKYLNSTYYSSKLDILFSKTSETNILGNDGEQMVYPYRVQDFYYESQQSGVSYSIKKYTNTQEGIDSPVISSEHDKIIDTIYEFVSYSHESIKNSSELYTEINYDKDGDWNTEYKNRSYDWYKARFGKFYYKKVGENIVTTNDTTSEYGEYIQVTDTERENFMNFYEVSKDIFVKIYYISSPVVEHFDYSRKFTNTNSEISFTGESKDKVNGYTYNNLDEIKKQTAIIINGVQIPITFNEGDYVEVTQGEGEDKEFLNGTYTSYPNLTLPNGCVVSKLVFEVTKETLENSAVTFVVNNVEITYSLTNVPLNKKGLTYLESSSRGEATAYELKVSTKRVIYNAYENGYWSFDDNFYSDDFSLATKYPTNLEIAETYIWSRFASNDVGESIRSAEDLARVASNVNSGKNSYEGITLTLENDIDLSGKYWIPIGTLEHPFKGEFDGNGKSIQYVSVNQNSNGVTFDSTGNVKYEPTQNYLDYSGLFGVISGANIHDLSILGGEVAGLVSGGLVGRAENSTISNILNRNSAFGLEVAGGIVGELVGGSLTNSNNYALVTLSSVDALDLYAGGLVGQAKDTTIGNDEHNVVSNSGKITAISTYTSYIATNSLVNLHVGGLVGKMTNTTLSYAQNSGLIKVQTNAHKLYIGGAVGETENGTVHDVKNNGQLDVSHSGVYQETHSVLENTALDKVENGEYIYSTVDVGGVVGLSSNSLSLLSNLSSIKFDAMSTNSSHISLGGIVGRLKNVIDNKLTVSESYNSGSIESTSTNSTTFGIGGVVGTIDLNKSTFASFSDPIVIISNNYNSGSLSSDSVCFVYMGGVAGYAYNEKTVSLGECVMLQNNINIGYVTIYDYVGTRNALGAIIGSSANCLLVNPYGDFSSENVLDRVSFDLNNFYLSGSAYSGSKVFTGYSVKTSDGTFDPASEVVDDSFYKEDSKFFFSKSLSSTDLKLKASFEMRKKSETEDTSFAYDFDNIWEQKYGTWYPTLKRNKNTSYWIDNAKEVVTSSTVYNISTADELSYMAKMINSGELASSNITIRLTKSIDLSNKFFTPIGTTNNPFRGTFDGGFYEIKNLTIDGDSKYVESNGNESFSNDFGGLFGVTNGATIKNLGIENPVVQEVLYASGVVSQATNSSLVSLYTDSAESSLTTSPSKIEGTFGAGGIVCSLINSKDFGNVKKGLYNSYNNVYVLAGAENASKVGGLVGEMVASFTYNCYNNYYGVVTVTDSGTSAGGVVIGRADKDSKIGNVFNLSPKLNSLKGNSVDNGPALYRLSLEDGKVYKTEETLSFDILEDYVDNPKSEIWTKEYSLNPSAVANYPSLSGLNREWKNSPSEALISFDYDGTNKQPIYNYIDSIKKVYNDEGVLTSGKLEYSLPNFAKDSFYDAVVRKIYLITSEEDLVWVANNVNNGNLLTSGVEFMLLKDLDLSGRYFTPIGLNRTYSFNGIFNFNGHVIKGLTIDSNFVYSGLFGYTQNALIINGYLTNAFIKIRANVPNMKAYAGALVGFAENTNIKNMVVSTCLTISSSGGTYVGGVVGYYTKSKTTCGINNVRVYGSSTHVDLGEYKSQITEKSIQEGEVSIAGFSVDGGTYVGGVVGYAVATAKDEDEKSKITSLVSYATVNTVVIGLSMSQLTTAHVGVGGVLGYGADLVKLDACYVPDTAKAKSYSNRFDSVGGIAGYNENGEIKNCKFDGYVEPRSSDGRLAGQIWSYVGGIVGICDGGVVSSCFTDKGTTITNASNKDYSAGAIIGLARYKSFANDEISVYINSTSSGFGSTEKANPVGKIENADGSSTADKDVYKIGSGEVTKDNGFSSELWGTGGVLNCKKIFVMGGGKESFDAITGTGEADFKSLLAPGGVDTPAGITIDDLNTLMLRGVSSGKIGIVYVMGETQNGTLSYVYFETDLTADDASEISILNHLGSGLADDVIVCFITKK